MNYYDKYQHLIQTVGDNHLRGTERISNLYNFAGELKKTIREHTAKPDASNNNKIAIDITQTFRHDHAGRLLETYHLIKNDAGGSAKTQLTSAMRYNELGTLIEKKLHRSNDMFLQSVDYFYNERGWLTKINNPSTVSENDLFNMELIYNKKKLGLNDGQQKYNGNISAIIWRSASRPELQSYTYSYDSINRIKSAIYNEKTGNSWANTNIAAPRDYFSVSGIDYDYNGNIQTIKRNGLSVTDPGDGQAIDFQAVPIDNLQYHYNGNRLSWIKDIAQSPTTNNRGDFKDGYAEDEVVEYNYDPNGNMTKDLNKRLAIEYNFLNLPKLVERKTNHGRIYHTYDRIRFMYDAGGNMLQKKLTTQFMDDTETTKNTTNYCGGIVYKNGQLQYIQTPEGHAIPNEGTYRYEYNLKDHLGNTRVTFTEDPETNNYALITNNYDYYPFGMLHNREVSLHDIG